MMASSASAGRSPKVGTGTWTLTGTDNLLRHHPERRPRSTSTARSPRPSPFPSARHPWRRRHHQRRRHRNGVLNPATVGATGTLTLAGGLTFAASAPERRRLRLGLRQIVVTGSVSLSTATLNVTGVAPTAGRLHYRPHHRRHHRNLRRRPRRHFDFRRRNHLFASLHLTTDVNLVLPTPPSSPARQRRRSSPASATRSAPTVTGSGPITLSADPGDVAAGHDVLHGHRRPQRHAHGSRRLPRPPHRDQRYSSPARR